MMTRFTRPLRAGFVALLGASSIATVAQPSGGPSAAAQGIEVAPRVAEPTLGRLRIFDDWAVACDNRLSCTAVSLNPEGVEQPNRLLVFIRRAGGPEGPTELRALFADQVRGRVEFMVDGQQRARQNASGDEVDVKGDTALTLVRALGSSFSFELRDRRRNGLGSPSLQGLPAALRYMDEQQGRIGSTGALAAIGDGPADMARPLPASPVLPAEIPVLAAEATTELTAEDQAAARRLAQCEQGLESIHPMEMHVLDREHMLLILPCDAGAYNVTAVPLLATGEPGALKMRLAPFDHQPGFTGDADAPPLVVNARWNPARGELSSFAKGRGLGDCGTAETYRWDGTRFRLTEARSMPVCRGAWEWPVLYSLDMREGSAQP
jgi:hypothetical protein